MKILDFRYDRTFFTVDCEWEVVWIGLYSVTARPVLGGEVKQFKLKELNECRSSREGIARMHKNYAPC